MRRLQNVILCGEGSSSRNDQVKFHCNCQPERKSRVTQSFEVERFPFSSFFSRFFFFFFGSVHEGRSGTPNGISLFPTWNVALDSVPNFAQFGSGPFFPQFLFFRTSSMLQILSRWGSRTRSETKTDLSRWDKTQQIMFADFQEHEHASLPRTSYCF